MGVFIGLRNLCLPGKNARSQSPSVNSGIADFRNKMKRAILLLALVALSISVAADWGAFTGAELVERCDKVYNPPKDAGDQDQKMFDSGVCLGYLHGIRLMLSRTDINYPPEFPKSCIPDGTAQTALVNAIYAGADALPHLLKQDATTLVVTAWSKAFPCPK
jgi:hypothetical protein